MPKAEYGILISTNQNFSKVVDEHGTAVILKNNVPKYLVIDFSKAEKEKVASNEDVLHPLHKLCLCNGDFVLVEKQVCSIEHRLVQR